jgi:ribose transport system ATP-binding protein
VIFISHDIDEVLEITDKITVLRDGQVVGEVDRRDASHQKIVEMIVGRSVIRGERRAAAENARPVYVRLKNLAGKMLEPSELAVGKGEILGLTGLIGSGYEEVPYLAFGARPARSGTIEVEDGTAIPQSKLHPKQAIEMGFALLPADRQGASGVDSLMVMDNMFLPDVTRFFRGGFMRDGAMVREARQLGVQYEVRPNDPKLKLAALSGGNAQKVLIARWMNRTPDLLLVDEPTQGVDVGTRQQIFAALRRAANDGMSIICASSDAEQLAEICDRVLVFAKGRICLELVGDELTKDGISAACYASMTMRAPEPTHHGTNQ